MTGERKNWMYKMDVPVLIFVQGQPGVLTLTEKLQLLLLKQEDTGKASLQAEGLQDASHPL